MSTSTSASTIHLPSNTHLIASSSRGILYKDTYKDTTTLVYKLLNQPYIQQFTSNIKELEKKQVEVLREINPLFSLEVIQQQGGYEGILRANGVGIPISLKGIKWKLKNRFLNRCIVKRDLLGNNWYYPLFPNYSYLLPKEEDELVFDADLGVIG